MNFLHNTDIIVLSNGLRFEDDVVGLKKCFKHRLLWRIELIVGIHIDDGR